MVFGGPAGVGGGGRPPEGPRSITGTLLRLNSEIIANALTRLLVKQGFKAVARSPKEIAIDDGTLYASFIVHENHCELKRTQIPFVTFGTVFDEGAERYSRLEGELSNIIGKSHDRQKGGAYYAWDKLGEAALVERLRSKLDELAKTVAVPDPVIDKKGGQISIEPSPKMSLISKDRQAKLLFNGEDLAGALKIMLRDCDRIEAAGDEQNIANAKITFKGRTFRLSVGPSVASIGSDDNLDEDLVEKLKGVFGRKLSKVRKNVCIYHIDWEIAEKELGDSMTKARENRILAQMDTDKTVLSETAEKIAPAKLPEPPAVSFLTPLQPAKSLVFDGPKPVRPDNRVITPLVLAIEKWVQTQLKEMFDKVVPDLKLTEVKAKESKISSGEEVIIINIAGSFSTEYGERDFSFGLSLYKSRAVFGVNHGYYKAIIGMQEAMEKIWGKKSSHPEKFIDYHIVTYYEFKLEDFLSGIKTAAS